MKEKSQFGIIYPTKESFKAGDSYFCSMVPNKKIEVMINDLARFC